MPPRPSASKHGTGDETTFAPRNAPQEERERARAGNAMGQRDERAVSIATPIDKQDEAGNETHGTTGGKDENGVSPRLTTSKTRRGRNEDGVASKRIHMRQVIDNIDERLLKTFSPFYLRV